MPKTIHIFILLFLATYSTTYSQNLQLKINISDSIKLTPPSYQSVHKNYNSVLQEIENFKNELQNRGYLSLKSDSLTRNNNIINYYLTANTKIDSIKLLSAPNNNYLNLTPLRFPITTTPENLNSILSNITNQLDKIGETFSSVSLSNISTEKNTLTAELIITRSKKRSIDSILVKGYEKFPKAFLSQYARIKTGKKFSKQQIEEKTNLLNNLSFINQTKLPEILFTKDSTYVYLYLEKKNVNYFDGYIGFNNDEKTNKLKFNGTININLTNNLNTGEQITIYWKNNGKKQSTFQSSLSIPYIFNTPITPTASLNILKHDSTFNTTSNNVNTKYNINSKNAAGIFYQNINSTNTGNSTSTNYTNIEDYKTYFTGITYSYTQNTTLNPILQNKGFNMQAGMGKRSAKTTTTNQQLIEFSGYYQFSTSKTTTFYIQNTTKILNSKNYLDNELFFFGGINSIRGYEENSLRANSFTVFNTEYRKLLSKKVYIHSITDYSYYKNKNYSQNFNLISIGVGLGIINQNSLFKIVYATSIYNGISSKLNNSKIHISYSTFF